MGKVRGLRARVHQAAVRPAGQAASDPAPPTREAAPAHAAARGVGAKEWAFMNTDVFAGTKIDPSALVQKLDPDTRSVASVRRGVEARAVLPKKEKLKLRRERWLQKIEAIKLAEQKRKAERRRRATVVVGDLQPLRDALPELLELEAGSRQPRARGASCLPGTWVLQRSQSLCCPSLCSFISLEVGGVQRCAQGHLAADPEHPRPAPGMGAPRAFGPDKESRSGLHS
ncbi:protein FAM207A isoform X1 [Zalophus californianus]|uniref:Protein FAM207A isoform X1 n=1 Tax=Zalophus californianus TaxID=9704 RepID=A0A6J2C974_ZALCA|nr:protein FAM207A isoform X1 [Zalophus californianus]